MTSGRKRHNPEQILRKLRDADAMLNAGKELPAVLQALEVSESTYGRWRSKYGGMKSKEALRLKKLEDTTLFGSSAVQPTGSVRRRSVTCSRSPRICAASMVN